MRAHGQDSAAWGRGLLPAVLGVVLFGLVCSGGEPPNERAVDLGGGVKMTFVLVPAGSFTMGSTEAQIKAVVAKWPKTEEELIAEERPAHKVTISKAFYMAKYEATVGQFRRFVEATGYKTHAEQGPGFAGSGAFVHGAATLAADASWRNPYFKQTDDHPVVCVTCTDAKAFADWLNATDKAKPAGWTYRLPTEAEWEYACRAGTTTLYQWGDNPDDGKGLCNAADLSARRAFPQWTFFNWDDGYIYSAPVGSFKANAFGLHDMHGNAAEWCQDWYGPYGGGEQTDPTGPASGRGRVIRGGSWDGGPGDCRSAYRISNLDGLPSANSIGFRLVLVPGP